MVGKRDFTRPWNRTSAKQPDVTDGMVRRPERSGHVQGFVSERYSGGRMNTEDLKVFIERRRRHDSGYALCDHRLA
ncbi:MAG: hypothetical protein BWY82_01627 [Verrucomicrobia bacterium ADurb.Bin474]|nr:MAG: hypothetical protein BWY82_01627 [Verrucomicrobia bacterium ADurb.Bin474]